MGPAGLPLGQLGLTEDQQARVKDVMERYRPEMKDLGDRLAKATDAQRKAVETVPVNEGLVRSTSDLVGTAMSDMAVLQARIHSDLFGILTPEQQKKATQISAERAAKAKEFRQQMQGRMGQMRERRGKRGPQ